MEVLVVCTEDTLYANVYKSPGIKGHQFKEGLDFLAEEKEEEPKLWQLQGHLSEPQSLLTLLRR